MTEPRGSRSPSRKAVVGVLTVAGLALAGGGIGNGVYNIVNHAYGQDWTVSLGGSVAGIGAALFLAAILLRRRAAHWWSYVLVAFGAVVAGYGLGGGIDDLLSETDRQTSRPAHQQLHAFRRCGWVDRCPLHSVDVRFSRRYAAATLVLLAILGCAVTACRASRRSDVLLPRPSRNTLSYNSVSVGTATGAGFSGFNTAADQQVHVTSLRVLGVPSGLAIDGTYAVSFRETGIMRLGATGDDLTFLRRSAHPITDAILSRSSDWYLLVVLHPTKRGTWTTTGIEVTYRDASGVVGKQKFGDRVAVTAP